MTPAILGYRALNGSAKPALIYGLFTCPLPVLLYSFENHQLSDGHPHELIVLPTDAHYVEIDPVSYSLAVRGGSASHASHLEIHQGSLQLIADCGSGSRHRDRVRSFRSPRPETPIGINGCNIDTIITLPWAGDPLLLLHRRRGERSEALPGAAGGAPGPVLPVAGEWRAGFAEPLWVITNLEPEEALQIYRARMKLERREQMEKMVALVLLA